MTASDKAPDAFRTIGELSAELGVAQHILRYWESRFPQLKPLQRAGNRRYYRPADVALARRIHRLLSQEGYTVKGVQKLLKSSQGESPAIPLAPARPIEAEARIDDGGVAVERLIALRDRLSEALSD